MGSLLGRCCHGTLCKKVLRFIFCISCLVSFLMLTLYAFLLLTLFNITMWQKFHTFDSLYLNNSKHRDPQPRMTDFAQSLWFNLSLSDNDSQMVMKALNDKYRSYLRPVTTIISNLPGISSRLRHLPEDIIHSGYGLHPFKTETGQDGWMENGIVYRPSRPQSTEADFYLPEYESYVPLNEDLFFGGRAPEPGYETKKKIILWYFPAKCINPLAGLEPMKVCPEFPCLVTTNRSHYFHQSAASIFGVRRPPQRTSQEQIFIMHNHEPQLELLINPLWKSVFNWTFSYRVDSDIVLPYAVIRKRPKALTNKDYRSIFAQKTGLVAWAVSHCDTSSRRKKYVEELRKYISVDIIGKCGTIKCRRDDRTNCTDEIARKYKFYLGFESAFCPDYITEKLFCYLGWDIVNVARGSNDYYLNIHSNIFINANDFRSAEKLAERLLYLAGNETAYIDMLRAKDEYIALMEDLPIYRFYDNRHALHNDLQFHAVPMCLICQRLWNLDGHSKTIKDITKWFNLRNCKAPVDLNSH